jgi:hypothetical protein
MLARIAVMKALNRHGTKAPSVPRRKPAKVYCSVIARGRGMPPVPHADAVFSVKLRRSAGTSQRSKSSKVERKAHPASSTQPLQAPYSNRGLVLT